MAATKKAAAAKKTPAKPTRPAATKKAPSVTKSPAKKAAAAVKNTGPAKAPTSPAQASGMDLVSFTHAELVPSPDNLRTELLVDIDDLAASIAEQGLLQPLVITMVTSEATAGRPEPWIVAGHRRHAAIGMLIKAGKWPKTRTIPCVVTNVPLADDERTVAMLVENLQRVDLDPIEEGHGYQRLVQAGWKQARIATATGRHQNRISERIRLLRLPAQWWKKISDGTLTLQYAAKLAQLDDAVLNKLAGNKVPSEFEVRNAEIAHTNDVAVEQVRTACEQRGLTFQLNPSGLQNTHVNLNLELTPKNLAKALLPDAPQGDLVVSLAISTYYPPSLTVWQRRTDDWADTPPPAEPAELTPYQAWQKECADLRNQHAAARTAWRAQRQQLLVKHCRDLDPKDVGVAVMAHWVNEVDPFGTATALGWVAPENVDEDTVHAHLDEWLSHPRNLAAAAAWDLLNDYGSKLAEAFDTLVTETIGADPVLVLPPDPTAPSSDVDIDDDEEITFGEDEPL
jgi:ParB/RepB/Spo0J family partition protein